MAQCVERDKEERVTVFQLLEGCMDERVVLSDPVLVERVLKGASHSSMGFGCLDSVGCAVKQKDDIN